MDVKVSIVIPVHNTGKYLQECFDSIIQQEFKEWELICVDDNSTDEMTLNILADYENKLISEKYNIQFYYSKKNIGAAEARNYGLKRAIGEYIIFLDSDDYYARDFLIKMYTGIKKDDSDVIMCAYKELIDDTRLKIMLFPKGYEKFSSIERWNIFRGGPWLRLCKKIYLEKNEIEFRTYTSCNDLFYCFMVMYCSDKIALLNIPLVTHRVGHKNQISYSRDPNNNLDAYEEIRCSVVKKGINAVQWEADILRTVFYDVLFTSRNWCKDDSQCKIAYYRLRDYVNLHIKQYTQLLSPMEMLFIQKLPYESKWYHRGDEWLYYSLEINSEALLNEILEREVMICGIGKRAKAFFRWAKLHNVKIIGWCDRKDDRCGNSIDGVPVYKRETALRLKCLLIATNNAVYEDIRAKTNNNILRLEEYCSG